MTHPTKQDAVTQGQDIRTSPPAQNEVECRPAGDAVAPSATVDDLRKAAVCIYIACEEAVAADIARIMRWAAGEIERLTAAVAFKDETNRCLQACITGEERLKEYVAGRAEFARRDKGGNHWAVLHGLINMIDRGALDAWCKVDRMTPEELEQIAREVEAELDATTLTKVGTAASHSPTAEASITTQEVAEQSREGEAV